MIKFFSHRGFIKKGIAQNSIGALKNAYLEGFRAIEFDIWFINKELLLSHDKPNFLELNKLTHFKDYFLYKNELEYWLDFKNIDKNNAKEVLGLVKKIINEEGINLDQIYFAPFIVDYKLAAEIFKEIRLIFSDKAKIMAVCECFNDKYDVVFLKNFLQENKINNLSIFHQLIDKNFVHLFSEVEIFAWTVNDIDRVKELNFIGIKNFATDTITKP